MTVAKIPAGLGQLLFCEQSAWGTPGTPNVAIEAMDIKWAPKRDVLSVNVQSVYPGRGPKAVVAGRQGGTLSFKTMLRGGNGAESATSKLLKNCGMTRTNYADKLTKITGATSTTLIALTADFTAISIGDAVLVKSASTDQQIRFVTRKQLITPDGTHTTLTVAPAFSDTPAASDNLYAIDTFYPAQGVPTKYLAFYFYAGASATAGTSPYYLLSNCAGIFKLGTTKTGGLPYIEWTFNVDTWVYVGAAAATLTTDAFAAGHPLLADKLYIDADAVQVADFGFDPGQNLQSDESTAGINGRAGWLYAGNEPKVEFTPYFDDAWVSTKYSSLGTFSVLMESIKGVTNAWAIWVPKCAVSDVAMDDAGNQHVATKPTLISMDPGLDADSVGPLPRFAIAITSV